jgi:glycine/D-amino acid oxidase-like deaminating enzyme/nitrite reductase/ring-hydroxylating ferredoxin subunit
MGETKTLATEQSTQPYWVDSVAAPSFKPLDTNLHVDVIVVGGGITGITAAYLLKRAGRTVALLDRGRCMSADTAHTTAHLTCVTDTRLSRLVRDFGRDHAQAVWDAGLAAIGQIDSIVRSERIPCEFDWVPGYLHAPIGEVVKDDKETRSLAEEASLATELGFDVEYLDRVPLIGQPGVRFEGQAKLHPLKYLTKLVGLIPGGGSHVFEHTEVQEVHDDPLSVHAGGYSIRGEYVIVATHTPLMGKTNALSATLLQTKLYPYTSYVLGGRVPKDERPEALFWDTEDPYHYLRIDSHSDHDYFIFGGEDHKTGQVGDTRACFARLEKQLGRMLPKAMVTHRWSGQIIETNDGLPYIGETSPRQFVATGFGGNGTTFGTLAAMMARDTVVGDENPWRELFDVGRTKIKGGLWNYIKENKDYPYYMLRGRFAGAEGKSLRSVKRGEGKIIELNGEHVAAFRSADGEVTMLSPTCTHMGCQVVWNTAERSWDCPCHGSRFTAFGEVLAGPAQSPLAQARSTEAASGRK